MVHTHMKYDLPTNTSVLKTQGRKEGRAIDTLMNHSELYAYQVERFEPPACGSNKRNACREEKELTMLSSSYDT